MGVLSEIIASTEATLEGITPEPAVIVKKGYSPYVDPDTLHWMEYDDVEQDYVDTGVLSGTAQMKWTQIYNKTLTAADVASGAFRIENMDELKEALIMMTSPKTAAAPAINLYMLKDGARLSGRAYIAAATGTTYPKAAYAFFTQRNGYWFHEYSAWINQSSVAATPTVKYNYPAYMLADAVDEKPFINGFEFNGALLADTNIKIYAPA